MFKRIIFFVVLFAFVSVSFAGDGKKRGTNNWDEYNFFGWRDDSRPLLELSYGKASILSEPLTIDFANSGLLEFKIGYNNLDPFFEDYIVEVSDKFLIGSKLSSNLSNKDINPGLKADILRLGLGTRKGYSYDLKGVSIFPYHQTGYVWSQFEMKEAASGLSAADFEVLNRYDNSFRFGTLHEAGVRVEILSSVSLNAGYESAVILPRHLFWKHLGSYAIEAFGIKELDRFIEEIMRSSPAVVPVINFILKNAYSYGFYLLKKDNMNWPFKTEAPLTHETFKFGVSFVF